MKIGFGARIHKPDSTVVEVDLTKAAANAIKQKVAVNFVTDDPEWKATIMRNVTATGDLKRIYEPLASNARA